jgi:hypothetical protein
MKRVVSVVLLTASASAWADCRESALEGDWTVFYRDNAFPTSVLAPDETLGISRDPKSGTFSVALTDPEWQGWNDAWEAVCVDGQTVLLGAIHRRHGANTLVIEISRVVTADDLLRNAAGVVRERQINIRFPQPFSMVEQNQALADLARRGLLASHPGHAHGWD